ncbi:hypothetical protein LZ32DRAFT_91 [Colletotrichum eremochloae]|nr:hypothetical protein LZ32DRAFT_91 [Colletotrichum eremochloae]
MEYYLLNCQPYTLLPPRPSTCSGGGSYTRPPSRLSVLCHPFNCDPSAWGNNDETFPSGIVLYSPPGRRRSDSNLLPVKRSLARLCMNHPGPTTRSENLSCPSHEVMQRTPTLIVHSRRWLEPLASAAWRHCDAVEAQGYEDMSKPCALLMVSPWRLRSRRRIDRTVAPLHHRSTRTSNHIQLPGGREHTLTQRRHRQSHLALQSKPHRVHRITSDRHVPSQSTFKRPIARQSRVGGVRDTTRSPSACQQMILILCMYNAPGARFRHHDKLTAGRIRPCVSRQTRLQPAFRSKARWIVAWYDPSLRPPELRGRNAAILFPIRELSPVQLGTLLHTQISVRQGEHTDYSDSGNR